MVFDQSFKRDEPVFNLEEAAQMLRRDDWMINGRMPSLVLNLKQVRVDDE
jgi:hypothetical protein